MTAASDDLVVLVVDDDFRVARLHAEYAARVPGVRVLEPVGTASAARHAIAQYRPGLVLLDAYLPDESGLDLLRDIDADVFLLSAASDADTVRTALRRGALCYLIKPFAAEALTDRIAAFQRFANVVPADPARTLDQEAIERGLRIVHSGDSPGGSRSRSATEQAVLDAVERADAGPDLDPDAVHGLGFGLPLSRDIARRSGGDLWLASRGVPGEHGAVFCVRIPGAVEPARPDISSEGTP